MANYPSVDYDIESRRETINGGALDIAVDGTVRVRQFHTEPVYRFRMIHSYISSTDATSIESNWATNDTVAVTLSWRDGSTYSVYYEGPPQVNHIIGAYWRAESVLIGTKD